MWPKISLVYMYGKNYLEELYDSPKVKLMVETGRKLRMTLNS
jgi:hypothetical protein